ncbi:YbaN family protein [Chitinibacter tainanensis]|uniref:YbaN family protein n=1 Tax=Chitinibacter tainanensis TaxID=230667 RepID=UPI0023552BF1|nr:YbaN family protein [Chitinibacter tainanensis]
MRPPLPRWQHYLLLLTGWLALLLAVLGILLPGLPSTPFILLAASCFVRASPRWHAWLLAHRWFGPPLRDWETHRSLPRKIKYSAWGLMLVSAGISLWLLQGREWLQGILLVGMATGAWVISRIPDRD